MDELDVGAVPINQKLSTSEIQTGGCIYCGQMRQYETMGMSTQDQLDKWATFDCDCEMAQDVEAANRKKETAMKNIHLVLTDKSPEVTDIFERNLDALIRGQIKSINVKTTQGITASIEYTNQGNIKIKRKSNFEAVMEG